MQNLVDVRRREGSLHREGIFRYFLCSILFCVLALAYRSHQMIDYDHLWLKTRVSTSGSAYWGSRWKKWCLEVKTPQKHDFGSLNRHFKPNLRNFRITISRKYAVDQHEISRGISGAQMDFVGGPALQNYNSRRRRPPSLIFAQTAISQPPIDVDEWNFAVM